MCWSPAGLGLVDADKGKGGVVVASMASMAWMASMASMVGSTAERRKACPRGLSLLSSADDNSEAKGLPSRSSSSFLLVLVLVLVPTYRPGRPRRSCSRAYRKRKTNEHFHTSYLILCIVYEYTSTTTNELPVWPRERALNQPGLNLDQRFNSFPPRFPAESPRHLVTLPTSCPSGAYDTALDTRN